MNVKNNIKKILAVAASVGLVGTTLVGALAYDLSDYPAPFVQDGVFAGGIVVGANAATADVLGAIDIAASLQSEAKTGTAIAASTDVSVQGGEDFTRDLNQASVAKTYDDGDLEGFQDDQSELDGTDYDFVEKIALSAGAFTVKTSGIVSYNQDENYGTDAYLEAAKDGLVYEYFFDDVVDPADFGTSTDTKDMDIKFLGKKLTINDVTCNTAGGTANNDINIEASAEFFMEEGDQVEVEGHKVTLARVGASSVLVTVDGQTLAVKDDGSKEQFDEANDFEVSVQSMFYIESAEDNSATLKLGESISDTYTTGDSMEMFGEPKNEDDATWVWDVYCDAASKLEYVGARLNLDYKKLGVTDSDERAALAMGESLDLPNNYASVEFAGWDDNAMDDFDTLEWEFSTEDFDAKADTGAYTPTDAEPNLGSVGMVHLTSSASDAFIIEENSGIEIKAEEVYISADANDDVYVYYDDGDKVYYAGEYDSDTAANGDVVGINLRLDDEDVEVVIDDTDLTADWNLDFASVDTIQLNVAWAAGSNSFTGFGTANTEEATDFEYDSASPFVAAELTGTDDEERKTTYGTYWDDISSQIDGDEFKLYVPHAQQVAKIIIKSKGSVVSAGGEGGMSYTVNPIALGLGVLDTDAPALGSKPMIVVGGPAANTVAADVMGNPTRDQLLETFSEGKALIKWYDDKQAMLVAGWDKQETLGASYVVARYGDYDFMGDELEVVVTSLDNIEVNSVTTE